MQKKLGENAESALLVSCIRKNATSSSKRKGRAADPVLDDENEVGEDSDHEVSCLIFITSVLIFFLLP